MSELTAARHPHGGHGCERLHRDVGELVVRALKSLNRRPQQLHRGLQNLIGASPALLDCAPRRFELWPVPPGADAVDEAPSRQVLQGGDLLRQHHGVVSRQDENRRPKLDPGGDRGDVAQGHQRLGPADSVEAPGGEQVVGDEQRFESELFRVGCKTPELFTVAPVLARQQVGRQEDPQLQLETIVLWRSRCLTASACLTRTARCATTRRPGGSSMRRAAHRLARGSPTPPFTWWPTRWPTPVRSGPSPSIGSAPLPSAGTSGATAWGSPMRWTPRSGGWALTGSRAKS